MKHVKIYFIIIESTQSTYEANRLLVQLSHPEVNVVKDDRLFPCVPGQPGRPSEPELPRFFHSDLGSIAVRGLTSHLKII